MSLSLSLYLSLSLSLPFTLSFCRPIVAYDLALNEAASTIHELSIYTRVDSKVIGPKRQPDTDQLVYGLYLDSEYFTLLDRWQEILLRNNIFPIKIRSFFYYIEYFSDCPLEPYLTWQQDNEQAARPMPRTGINRHLRDRHTHIGTTLSHWARVRVRAESASLTACK